MQKLTNPLDLLELHTRENYSGILFDLDGTVLNSEMVHAHAISSAINKSISAIEIKKHYLGMSDLDVHFDLQQKQIYKNNYEQFIEDKNQNFKNFLNQSILLPEIKEVLQNLDKNKVFLVTASDQYCTDLLISFHKLENYFSKIITANQFWKTKPSAAPYLFAMRQLGVNSKNALIIEDSDTGLTSARLTGANIVKAEWYID